jgi:hypothetical protein
MPPNHAKLTVWATMAPILEMGLISEEYPQIRLT